MSYDAFPSTHPIQALRKSGKLKLKSLLLNQPTNKTNKQASKETNRKPQTATKEKYQGLSILDHLFLQGAQV